MVRVSVVGLGKMGLSHYAILNAHPKAEVPAICDTFPFVLIGLEKQNGVKPYDDFKKLINEANLDGVVIATPNKTHAEMSRYALENGVSVFCEKPFTLDIGDSMGLARLAQDRKLVSQVGYHNRFIGTFREARRLVRAKALGDVHHITAEAYGQVVIREQGESWRSEKGGGGGCLHDYCSHIVDLVNFVMDPPKEVTGTVLQSVFSDGVEDAVYSTMHWENGACGQIAVNWSDETYRKMTNRLTVYGKKGKLVVDRQELRIYLREKGGFEDLPQGWSIKYITGLQEPVGFYLRGEEYSAQMNHFVESLANKKTDKLYSFASAVQTDTVIDMLARNGRRS